MGQKPSINEEELLIGTAHIFRKHDTKSDSWSEKGNGKMTQTLFGLMSLGCVGSGMGPVGTTCGAPGC